MKFVVFTFVLLGVSIGYGGELTPLQSPSDDAVQKSAVQKVAQKSVAQKATQKGVVQKGKSCARWACARERRERIVIVRIFRPRRL
jgi:hypothetical protein